MNRGETKRLQADNFFPFKDKYASAWIGRKMGAVDLYGNTVLPFNYDYVETPTTSSINLFLVTLKRKSGFVDSSNYLVIPLDYNYAEPFTDEGLAVVEKDGNYGFIDVRGNAKIPLKYIEAMSFSENLAFVIEQSGELCCINTQGVKVLSLSKYSSANSFENGLAVVNKKANVQGDILCGVIDKRGNEIIPCNYVDLFFIANDILKGITINYEEIYFDLKGNKLDLYSEFNDLNNFVNNYASVSKDGKYGLIDKSGNLLISYQYASPLVLEKGSSLAVTSTKPFTFGAISIESKQTIIPFNYCNVKNLGQNRYFLEISDYNKKVVDQNLDLILDCKNQYVNKYIPLYILIMGIIGYWFFFS